MKKLVILLLVMSANVFAQEELAYKFQNEMYSKSLNELKLLRNEFFAKQGYRFKNEELNAHFSQFDWYNGNKSISEIQLSELDKRKVNFIKKVENQKKLNNTRIKTLELLAVLPAKSMKSWDWPLEDRIAYINNCKKVGYLINDNSGMMQKRFINDKHLFVQVVDGTWEFLVIQLNGTNSFLLTNDIVTGGNNFNAYLTDSSKITTLNTAIFPENWEENFKPVGINCELSSSPFSFDFTLDNETIIIKSWEDECLLKKELKLKFNKKKKQYEIQN